MPVYDPICENRQQRGCLRRELIECFRPAPDLCDGRDAKFSGKHPQQFGLVDAEGAGRNRIGPLVLVNARAYAVDQLRLL
jgi:hypothetical protein